MRREVRASARTTATAGGQGSAPRLASPSLSIKERCEVTSVGVVVVHPDPAVVRALVGSIDRCEDLYVAGTDTSTPADVILAGGSALEGLRPPLGAPVLALAEEGEEIRAARAALVLGAREIVRWPSEGFRLEGALRLAASARADVGAHVVAVVGARGGAGTTTVALAFSLAAEAVAIDLGGGGMDILADEPGVQVRLPVVAPDVIVGALEPLGGDSRVLRAGRIPSDRSGLIEAARKLAPYVVVDSGRDRRSAAGADRTVIVCADDVQSARGLRALVSDGLDPHLVIVRRERRSGVAARDVAAAARDVSCVAVPRDVGLARALDLGKWPRRATRASRALSRAWELVSG